MFTFGLLARVRFAEHGGEGRAGLLVVRDVDSSRDTKPELEVRRALYRLGLRYRVALAPEPGLRRRAEIVFTGAPVVVHRRLLLA